MKKTAILVVLAITLRLVLAATTYHSDLGAFALAGKFVTGEGKWFTFYDAANDKNVQGESINFSNIIFNYQPLAYLIPSFFYLPFTGLVNSTGVQIADRNLVTSGNSPFNPLLLLYKYPMILADLAFLWLLPKFFKSKKKKEVTVLLWAFNPLAIFVSSMMGQVDIIIALFITLAIYLYQKNRSFLAVVLISLSALIKPAGLILIPLLALHHYVSQKRLLVSALLFATGLMVYIGGILPYLGSGYYRHFALFAEQISKSTYAGISIASGHDIPYFFIFYTLIALLVWKKRLTFSQGSICALLSSLVFSHFHPQWLVWVMPWLTLYTVKKSDGLLYLLIIFSWLTILFSFDGTLHLQMFLHSKLSLPSTLTGTSYFQEMVQIARASLITCLVWFTMEKNVDTKVLEDEEK